MIVSLVTDPANDASFRSCLATTPPQCRPRRMQFPINGRQFKISLKAKKDETERHYCSFSYEQMQLFLNL